MGIGFALASGLVQGFTQNIGREMERRQGERERLDALSTALITAGVGDAFNNKNIGVIQDYVQRGYQNLDAQGGIDLFGTRGANIITEEDVTGLLGQLQTTAKPDDEDEIDPKYLISYEDTVYRFPMDMYSDLTAPDAVSAMQELNTAMTSDLTRFQAAPQQLRQKFYDRAQTYGTIVGLEIANTPEGREYPDLDAIGFMNLMRTFDYNYKLSLPKDQREKYKSPFTEALRNANPKNEVTGEGGDAIDIVGDGSKVLELAVPMGMQPYAESIANNFGTSMTAKSNEWWNSYTTTLGQTAEYQELLWETTLAFANEFKITPTAFQDPMAMGKVKEDVANDMIKYLERATGNDVVAMSYVLGAFLKPEKFGVKKPHRPLNAPSSVGSEENSVRLFAARLYISASATDKDFDKIITQHDAIERVLSKETGLYAFRDLIENEFDAPAVLSRYMKAVEAGVSMLEFIFGAGGESGGDVVSFDVGAGLTILSAEDAAQQGYDTETGTKANSEDEVITQEFITKRRNEIDFARTRANKKYDEGTRMYAGKGAQRRELTREEMASAYARFEAMRISLAFQMARAADPSGRLSNQDVLQQLVRLGGDLDTPEHMIEKVNIAITEFENSRKRYAALMQYASFTNTVTDDARLFIQGTKAVNDLASRAGREGLSSVTKPAGAASGNKYLPTFATNTIFNTADERTFQLRRDNRIYDVDTGIALNPKNPDDLDLLNELYQSDQLPEGFPIIEGYNPPAATLKVNPNSSTTTTYDSNEQAT